MSQLNTYSGRHCR